MNVGIVLVLLAVVIFALKMGMVWVALAAATAMLLFAGDSVQNVAKNNVNKNFSIHPGSMGAGKNYLRPSEEDYVTGGGKTQTLQIMNWPDWNGDEFWEVGIHRGSQAFGKWFGMLK